MLFSFAPTSHQHNTLCYDFILISVGNNVNDQVQEVIAAFLRLCYNTSALA